MIFYLEAFMAIPSCCHSSMEILDERKEGG